MKQLFAIISLLMAAAIPAWADQPVVQEEVSPKVNLSMPLELTAQDFITKVYGFLDTRLTRQQALDEARFAINLIPKEDEYGFWLETDDGYGINYYGMSPEVSAHAAYGPDEHVSAFGFFFLFPYTQGERDKANSSQAQFSSTLLQELLDMGLQMQVDDLSDALFEVTAENAGDAVDIRLIEERNTDDQTGRFILIISVNPEDGYTAEAK